ncbi:DNA polymerase III subunit delta [Acinetobacter rathckeae]|uniref:DNA polymerase III subunit delta n=1 Tax=Acinetobacter rathckeae TaxID=2605272 RepID=UPI0018A28589|nr:DNA polymerase III subunit delta [Acinetobacter rathckeae]MBF7687827.1 DNA polymerase III subunit delta [Acinetobacter rathckeae]MBF7687950.1 DNA polymerase III subunit delta [Acinetobacter rathckeae]
MKIDYFQALKHSQNALGAWILHGQEPLLEQNLLDQFRKHWQSQDIERQRYDIQNVSDWKQVFQALNSLSLFSQALAIEVHSHIKPDAQALKQLKLFIQDPQENTLVVVMPKQDSAGFKSSFFKTVEANGVVVSLHLPYEKDQQNVLELEAKKVGIQLEKSAWKWLLEHHEHNLLAAKNSLIRVSDTFPEHKNISIDELLNCLQDQSRYSIYDLSDALLKADFAQSVKIYQYLVATDEPMSLILWLLNKEMRLLMQIFEDPQSATQLGIWQNKVRMYQQAVQRFQPHSLLQWPALLLHVDLAIKGHNKQPAHLTVLQIIATLCGKPLFN